MAQTGYTPIQIYSSTTASQAPAAGNLTNSTLGSELAINITDGKLFYKDNGGSVQVIAWKVTPTSAGGTGLTSYTAGDTLYYASGTTLSKLAIGSSGYYMSSSGTAPQWSAPAALTKTDDTNVTLTLGGSASTALLNAASLTLGWTGQLAASRGGTGIGSYTVGDILYASGTTTLSKLADVATGNALISGGVGVAPSWGKIGLTTHISGTLPTANGGTNLTSFTANGVMYASSTSALATSSTFTWDGTTHALTANGSGFKAMTGSDSANYYAGFLANYSYGEVLRFYVKGGSVAESTILSWGEGAGLTINNGGASAPVIVKAANSEVTRFFASGGVSIGNTTDPGATNLSVSGNILSGTTSSSGSLSNTKTITGGLFQTLSGTTASLANGATEDISNLTSGAAYLVTCRGSSNTTTFVIHTVYVNGAGGITLATLSNGNGFALTSPSNNTLRVTGLVTTQTYPYTLTRIF